MNMVYTVEIQAGDEMGTVWQAMHPAETVTVFNGQPAEQVAWDTYTNQTILNVGSVWRICVWQGSDADTSTDPAFILDGQTVADRQADALDGWERDRDGDEIQR